MFQHFGSKICFDVVWSNTLSSFVVTCEVGACAVVFAGMHIPMTLSAEISVGNPLHIRMLMYQKTKKKERIKKMSASCLNKSVASH